MSQLAEAGRVSPFDIFFWQPPEWPEPHPCVVISHPDRCLRKDPIEVVVCSTQRAGRLAQPHEVMLDEADGLDWPTLCKCDLIYAVRKEELTRRAGRVSEPRQGAIVRTIIGAHKWGAVL